MREFGTASLISLLISRPYSISSRNASGVAKLGTFSYSTVRICRYVTAEDDDVGLELDERLAGQLPRGGVVSLVVFGVEVYVRDEELDGHLL